MKLHFLRQGKGPSLFLLHGLFGSGDNLLPAARLLEPHFDIISPDLRNHGRSPHDSDCSFQAMATDIAELMDTLGLASAHVLGHSLGGKVAMRLALDQPGKLQKLIVADIAPRAYGPIFSEIFEALENLDLDSCASRRDAELALSTKISDSPTRLLLLKNLGRNEEGKFYWKMNLAALSASRPNLRLALESKVPFNGPALFLKGSASDYIEDADFNGIQRLFPQARLQSIPQAGHWLHAQQPAAFAQAVASFLA